VAFEGNQVSSSKLAEVHGADHREGATVIVRL